MDYEVAKALDTAEKTNFLNKNIQYLKNIQINEYDIKSAGFSVIKFLKLLPKEEIERIEKMEKQQRVVSIGLAMRKNPEIAKQVELTLAKVRKAFILSNNIPDYSILSIKKDSFFLIKQNPEILSIKDLFNFRLVNRFSSYALINEKEFYLDSKNDKLIIKGIPKEFLEKTEFVQNSLKTLLKQSEKFQNEKLVLIMKQFSKKYISRELPIEIYRELDTGCFRIDNFLLDNCDDSMKEKLDISQNYLKYFLPLISSVI